MELDSEFALEKLVLKKAELGFLIIEDITYNISPIDNWGDMLASKVVSYFRRRRALQRLATLTTRLTYLLDLLHRCREIEGNGKTD